MVPPEITVHFERMWNGTWGSQPEAPADSGHKLAISSSEANEIDWALFGFDVNKMNDDVARGASSLSNIGPDVLVYACTSGTWHKGYMAFDQRMAEIMEESSGIPSITAVTACIAALRHMGSRRISIAGPYRNYHLRNRLKPLMEEAGFEVLSADGEPWMQDSMNPREIDAEPPQTIIDFVPTVAQEEARHHLPPRHGVARPGRRRGTGAEAGKDGHHGEPGHHLAGPAPPGLDQAHPRLRQPAAQPGVEMITRLPFVLSLPKGGRGLGSG